MNSLNIVAHPDDDLLFLNPDILQDIEDGVTPIVLFMTYGDDGTDDSWGRKVDASQTVYGGPENLGWAAVRSNSHRSGDKYGTLYELYSGILGDRHDFHGNVLSRGAIISFIHFTIKHYAPSIIRTHNPNREPAIDRDGEQLDHIDHIYTAKFVQEAAKAFPAIPVFAYEGYPIRYMPPNVSPELAEKKKQMWRKYQEIDTEVAGEIWDIALDRCYKEQIQ